MNPCSSELELWNILDTPSYYLWNITNVPIYFTLYFMNFEFECICQAMLHPLLFKVVFMNNAGHIVALAILDCYCCEFLFQQILIDKKLWIIFMKQKKFFPPYQYRKVVEIAENTKVAEAVKIK